MLASRCVESTAPQHFTYGSATSAGSMSALERARSANARASAATQEEEDADLDPDARPGPKSVEMSMATVVDIKDDPSGLYGPAFYHDKKSLRNVCSKLCKSLSRFLIFIFASCTLAAVMTLVEGPTEDTIKIQKAAEWDRVQAEQQSQASAISAAISGNAAAERSFAALLGRLTEKEGLRPSVERRDWTFIGALYYVLTVSTTIGYGPFVPATDAGRIVTVIICMVGIWTFVSALVQFGRAYGHYFGRVADRITEALLDRSDLPEARRELAASIGKLSISFIVVIAILCSFGGIFHALVHSEGDEWSYWECVHFGVITLTTVGLGDRTLHWYGQTAGWVVFFFVNFVILGLAAVYQLILSWMSFIDLVPAFRPNFLEDHHSFGDNAQVPQCNGSGEHHHSACNTTPVCSPSCSSAAIPLSATRVQLGSSARTSR